MLWNFGRYTPIHLFISGANPLLDEGDFRILHPYLGFEQCCSEVFAAEGTLCSRSSSNRSSARWPLLSETRWDLTGDPGLETPHQILVSSGLWVGNYRHSYVSTHFKLWPRQLKIERPRSAVTPFFFFPPRNENTHPMHICFLFFLLPFSSFIKS